ncbi:MAG: tRNA (guanosine(46)-N7)-methyltransferase TrmB [Clostridia bacterium]|nr:tRNA (guanosine(46)-N7)-methyltransferase TrmB [Clostridia bacterium]
MRIRRKKWAEKELQEAKFYIDKPEINKGKWNNYFKKEAPLYVELGCGKGLFISTLAVNNKNINFIAVDMIEAMLGLSKRNIEEAYQSKEPENLALIRANVELIDNVFGDGDKVDRIYINFCNPWPKAKHNKRRLTHTRQLEKYKTFLKEKGEIYFKTDDDELFEASLEYFKESNFKIKAITYDLHKEPIFETNIETEHEKMFSEEGIKIKALIARL